MNLKELKTMVDFVMESLQPHQDPGGIKVLITLSERSIGARAASEVRSVGLGFDWEGGQFRIEPSKHLVTKGYGFSEADIICRQYDGKDYYFCPRCDYKISKNDKFCRYCGQKIKDHRAAFFRF